MSKETPHYQVMMGSYTVKDFVNQINKVTYTYDEQKKEWKDQGEGILIAPFQRTYQWHTKNYPLYLLDSLNQNIFVMPVILIEHTKKTWIIDGQQRLATLYCFVNDYQPKENKPIKWEELITAIKNKDKSIVESCKWTELDGRKFNKDKILNTPIGYAFLFNVNHEDDNKLLVDIFDRINNQGEPITISETINAYSFYIKNLKNLLNKYPDYEVDAIFFIFSLLATHTLDKNLWFLCSEYETLHWIKSTFSDDNKYQNIENLLDYLFINLYEIRELIKNAVMHYYWFNHGHSEWQEIIYSHIYFIIIKQYIKHNSILERDNINYILSHYREIKSEHDFTDMCSKVEELYIKKLHEVLNNE